MVRRSYSGGANTVTLTGPITAADLTIPTTAQTNWPNSANGPYSVVINRGGATEEKCLISGAPAGLALTVATRGYDGTTAQTHAASETVEHCLTAIDMDEDNEHVNDTTGVHGLSPGDRVVGETRAATLRNKTMSGANNTFSNIPRIASPELQADIAAEATARAAADALLLPLAGGTLTGPLILNADPVNVLGAASKQYVDAADTTETAARTAADALRVLKAGDTMTGPLVLPGNPVSNLQAATKQYVDSTIGGVVPTGAWTAYLPTIAGSTGFSLGNGTRAGRYLQIGKIMFVVVVFDPGTTTNFGSAGTFSVSLPVQKSSSWAPAVPNDGQAAYYNGAQYTTGMVSIGGGTSVFTVLIQATGTSVNLGRWTAAFPAAQAAGDHWSFQMFYETV